MLLLLAPLLPPPATTTTTTTTHAKGDHTLLEECECVGPSLQIIGDENAIPAPLCQSSQAKPSIYLLSLPDVFDYPSPLLPTLPQNMDNYSLLTPTRRGPCKSHD